MFCHDNLSPDERLCSHVLKDTVTGVGLVGKAGVPPLSFGSPRGGLGFKEPRYP